jgi:hypothetical protein
MEPDLISKPKDRDHDVKYKSPSSKVLDKKPSSSSKDPTKDKKPSSDKDKPSEKKPSSSSSKDPKKGPSKSKPDAAAKKPAPKKLIPVEGDIEVDPENVDEDATIDLKKPKKPASFFYRLARNSPSLHSI